MHNDAVTFTSPKLTHTIQLFFSQEENWDLASHQLQNAERLFREIGNEKAAREAAKMHTIAAERAQAKEKQEKLKQSVCERLQAQTVCI